MMKASKNSMETLNSWNSDSDHEKIENLVYYVKLLNIFIIMEIKEEWENAFFSKKTAAVLQSTHWPPHFN